MADAGVGEAAAVEGAKTAGEAAAGAGALETGTAMGGAAGVLGAADSAAASTALGLTAADVAGTGLEAGTAGGLFGAGGSLSGGAGASAGGLGSWLSSMGGTNGVIPSAFHALGGARGSLGIMQTLSSLYGLSESNKLRKGAGAPNPGQLTSMPGYKAGLDAVQRSMAAQGYQGSGNMMAALQKYGGDAYSQMWQGNQNASQIGMGGLMGQLSSLGLLSSGISNLAGWGGH